MENILSNLPRLLRRRKRIGRGEASGHGKTSGRGGKGQSARTGSGRRPGFEGGQTTLIRRTPKRGFYNQWRTDYEVVNIGTLEEFEPNTVVTPELLKANGIIKTRLPLKILGDGTLTKPLTVHAHRFSEFAKTKIEALKGKIEYIGGIPVPKEKPKKVEVMKEKQAAPKPEKVEAKKVEAKKVEPQAPKPKPEVVKEKVEVKEVPVKKEEIHKEKKEEHKEKKEAKPKKEVKEEKPKKEKPVEKRAKTPEK